METVVIIICELIFGAMCVLVGIVYWAIKDRKGDYDNLEYRLKQCSERVSLIEDYLKIERYEIIEKGYKRKK